MLTSWESLIELFPAPWLRLQDAPKRPMLWPISHGFLLIEDCCRIHYKLMAYDNVIAFWRASVTVARSFDNAQRKDLQSRFRVDPSLAAH